MKPIAFSKAIASTFGLALSLAAAGCSESEKAAPQTNIEVKVSPLTLEGIGNAKWRVTVRNGGSPAQTVWTRELDADRFGNGVGSVSYVGPCDASPGFEMHTISLELLDLFDTDGVALPTDSYQNPTIPTPLTQTVECRENADTPVTFNVVVMRRAEQGFFDVAVNFDNVFCSAKLDCADEFLLYPADDPDGRTGRGPTAIIAFACTTGSDAEGNARPTYMYLNEIKVECPREAPTPAEVAWVFPTNGPGNLGPRPPLLYQTAIYYGQEGFTNINKCYWNLALGIEVDEITSAGPCRVTATGTASAIPFESHEIAADQMWPIVTWDVLLENNAGDLACSVNPLNGQNSGVQTEYVGPNSGAFFTYEMSCDGDPVINTANSCGVAFQGNNFFFTRTMEGMVASWGNATSNQVYTLPNADWRLDSSPGGGGCCADACCQ